MPIKPIRDLLYIIPIDREDKIGRFHVPDSVRQPRRNQGVVKYRGPRTTGEVKVGDHVLFSGYDGDEVVLEGEGLLILVPEPFIAAVLLEGEDNYVLTASQVRTAVDVAVQYVSVELGEEDLQRIAKFVGERLKGHMNSRFFEELFF